MRTQPVALAPSRLERTRHGSVIASQRKGTNELGTFKRTLNGGRIMLDLQDGCVLIISDQHYHAPLGASISHRVALRLAKELKPWAIINNGDTLDLATISRWPVASLLELGQRPTIQEELKEAKTRLEEFEKLDFVKWRVWNLGNHDARYESYIAQHADKLAGLSGMTLKERFAEWLPAWRTDIINKDGKPEVIIQHRFKGGMHAGQNNVLWSGTNYVTGHDHMLKAYPVTNVHGLYWGIHAGTMAPIDSQLFLNYTEDRPKNWQEGFVILQFRGGKFIGPELVHCTPDGRAIFRGEVLQVGA